MSHQHLSAYELADSKIGNGRFFVLMAAVLLVQFLTVVLTHSPVVGKVHPLFREDGPIEALSPVGYILCVVLIIALGGSKFALTRAFSLIVVLLAMATRELDFNNRFTTMSVTKVSFFRSADDPLYAKILAFAALALTAWAVVHMLVTYGRDFFAGLRRLSPMSVAAALSVSMIALSEGLDGIARPLAKLGFPITLETILTLVKVEETLELGISIFAALAILAYFSARQDRQGMLK